MKKSRPGVSKHFVKRATYDLSLQIAGQRKVDILRAWKDSFSLAAQRSKYEAEL
jgi:hypothetical protein